MESSYFYNVSIEQTVLSSVLFSFDGNVINSMLYDLKADHFYLAAHKEIYFAIMKLTTEEKPIDEEFLRIELERAGKWDEVVMLNVMSAAPVASATVYIEQLKEYSKRRKISDMTLNVKKMFAEQSDSTAIASYIDQEMMSLNKDFTASMPKSMRDVMKEYDGVPLPPKIETGIAGGTLDKMLMGGIEAAQLIHIGGPSNVGKTTLTRQILKNVSVGFNTLFFSFEMQRRKIMELMRNAPGDWDIDKFYIIDQQMMGTDIADVAWVIKRWKQLHDISFVVIDSKMKITNNSMKNSSSSERIGDIDATLSQLCQQLNIVILVITQLNAEDQRNGTMNGYGSRLSDYEADMKILMSFQTDSSDVMRVVKVIKTRQDASYEPVELSYNTETNLFVEPSKSYTMANSHKVIEYQETKVEMPDGFL